MDSQLGLLRPLEEVALLASISPSALWEKSPWCCETPLPSPGRPDLPSLSIVHGPREDGEQLSPRRAPQAWEPAGQHAGEPAV